MNRTFDWPVRVYWEDTDAGGIVYHSNYLRFWERARTELLRSLGVSQSRDDQMEGVQFVVADLSIAYRSPARLDDELVVRTSVHEMRRVSMTFRQVILRGTETVCEGLVRVAVIDPARRTPKALPESVRALFAPWTENASGR